MTDFNLSKSQPLDTQDHIASVQSLVANNPRWQPPEVTTLRMGQTPRSQRCDRNAAPCCHSQPAVCVLLSAAAPGPAAVPS